MKLSGRLLDFATHKGFSEKPKRSLELVSFPYFLDDF